MVVLINFSSFQAVVRVSKQFLPHMSALLESPKVKVFIGDGFKFLSDNVSSYDVIITDSSDPVGPAASLFEKPYFQLLHDALTPGGNISTQAECLWLHLPLIRELRCTTLEIFETAEYAYTTIPTYPSGQIGFLVCSTMPNRDLKTALRTIPNTRYYNSNVHKAAFVLPEFGRALIEENKNVLPSVGRAARALAEPNKPRKKVLLLGSGYVARPAAEYIIRDPSNDLTIGASNLDPACVTPGLKTRQLAAPSKAQKR
jgi:spermidine synthase / saccharopine dehydrogenase (NADP+, L-glutamate-forming)